MTDVISIINHKGGVGKTSTAVNTAAILASSGYRVLLIDLDPQGNSTCWLDGDDDGSGLLDLLLLKNNPLSIHHTMQSDLDLICGGMALASAGKKLEQQPDAEFMLKGGLSSYLSRWDIIFIDCPPSLGILTLNALTASDQVLVPLETSPLGLKGLEDSSRLIQAVQNKLNPDLEFGGVIPCRIHARRSLHRDIISLLEEKFPNRVAPGVRENVAIAEAPAYQLPVHLYKTNSSGATDYRQVAKWLQQKLKSQPSSHVGSR